MPPLREVARFSGDKAIPYPVESLDGRTWLVWNAMKGKGGEPFVRSGKTGQTLRVNVRDIVHSLWPTAGQDELTTMSSDIRAHLRQTGSAHCLFPNGDGVSRTPVWWVADVYASAAVVQLFRETRREARLSPREAGEDRDPEPVTVTRAPRPGETPPPKPKQETPVAAAPQPIPAAVPSDDPEDEEPTTAVLQPDGSVAKLPVDQLLMDVLTNSPQPLTRVEWVTAAGYQVTGRSIPRQVSEVIGELRDDKRVFTREETAEERKLRAGSTERAISARRALLFWPTSPVPPRTERVAVGGYEFDPIILTAEQLQIASRKSYEASLDKVMEYLDALGPDPYIQLNKLSEATEVAPLRMRWVFDQMLDAGLLQVSRQGDDHNKTRVRLARNRRATDAETYRKKTGTVPAPGPAPIVTPAPVVQETAVPQQTPAQPAQPPAAAPAPAPAPKSSSTPFQTRLEALIEAEVEARLAARADKPTPELVEARQKISELEVQVTRLKTTVRNLTE